ncbi:TPA: IreB family regulatory phosphoprotein, partial [Clostridioides difficile]|nr:IreB family regulatory phosphoprotein [Clostridioides difficile]
MEKDLDYTMKFEGIPEDRMSVGDTIDFVYKALVEKGYNPINQII